MCKTKILTSLHSKNALESNQSEIKMMPYNNSPSSVSFETTTTKVNEYTSTADAYDKLKDISSLSNNGIITTRICSTTTVTTPPNPANTTSVSIPSIGRFLTTLFDCFICCLCSYLLYRGSFCIEGASVARMLLCVSSSFHKIC
uniref:Uncharacterized protein n=1 Tax=Trichobilharzia regenti TaxID=157069 RepID=A0AA85J288_TRIRE|nr:unnamed protein product [Trichobilharzia regenti]